MNEHKDLESAATTILHDYQVSDRPALVVFGPNSSGKTSFIQRFLAIGNILPSGIGPVTARIVHLSYASQEQASFYVYDTIEQSAVKHHESLAPFFVNRTEPDWSGISQRLSPHLKRPSNINAKSSEFSEWAKSLVEIHLPSNILQLGIDLYDTPGFLSERREEVLIANLHQLVKRIRPTLLFLYENATINETERSCFLAMKNAVNGLERVPVFFLNTKADCISIANDFMLDDDPDNVPNDVFEKILLEKRQRCYELLRKREEMANEVLGELPPSIEQCTCFDICTTPSDYDPWEQYTVLINSGSFRRIVHFAVETFSMPALATANDLLTMVDNYFDLLVTTTPRPTEQWLILRDEALKWGGEFFAEFIELMPTLVDQLMNNIQGLFEHLKGPIAQRAAAVERHDDPIDQLLQDNAKSIREYLQLAVREQIIKVAANKTIIEQRDNIREKIAVHFQRQKGMRKNELLTLAQRQVLQEVSIDVLENTKWFNSILDGIMKVKMRMIRYFCSLPSRWHSLAREKLSRLSESQTPTIDDDDDVFTLLDAMDAYATLSNENNRRLFADSCMTKLAEEILQKKPTFTRNLTTWVQQEQQTFSMMVNEIHRCADKHFSKISSSSSLLEKFSSPLARIECQLLAVMDMSKHNGIAPTIDAPIGHGGFYSVHAVHWNDERNLAVKKLLQRSTEHEQMMALEIHYHRAVTRICPEYIAPLLYVYENPLLDNQRESWIIMPRYRQSLQEYLKVHISQLSFEQCINWALIIGQAVAQLHRFDFTHRDLKSTNVMIDDDQRCYLIDFGTVKVGLCNRTVLGTLPLPPEMLTAGPVSYDGAAVDIYCFGLLLYELLPKTTYDRLDRDKLSRLEDLLKTNPKCDESTQDYERLVLDCLQNTPTSRPRSDVIVCRLKEIQKKAEVKLCTVCEERERALRFVPCQHKVMCEACWQSWSGRSSGGPKCIVCEAVVRDYIRDTNNATFVLQ